MTEQLTSRTCPVCKRQIRRYDGIDHDFCSEFCETTTDKEKADFLALKDNEYGVYPCSECGCAMEGEYKPGGWCSTCHPKRSARVRGELLREVLAQTGLPADLIERIKAEVKWMGALLVLLIFLVGGTALYIGSKLIPVVEGGHYVNLDNIQGA
jgi:hypothetical protein